MRQLAPDIPPARRCAGARHGHGAPLPRRATTSATIGRRGHGTTPRVRNHRVPGVVPDPVVLAAATWLACGIVLLGLTPLPLHDATLGWSSAFWMLAAPAILLLARLFCARTPYLCDRS